MIKGDIVLVPFPFTDLTGSKFRPALVLISGLSDVTVAFITSQVKWQDKFDLMLDPTPLNGLKQKSFLRLTKLATMDTGIVIGKLGECSPLEMTLINRTLVEAFQLND